jgi:hypothetical protein
VGEKGGWPSRGGGGGIEFSCFFVFTFCAQPSRGQSLRFAAVLMPASRSAALGGHEISLVIAIASVFCSVEPKKKQQKKVV